MYAFQLLLVFFVRPNQWDPQAGALARAHYDYAIQAAVAKQDRAAALAAMQTHGVCGPTTPKRIVGDVITEAFLGLSHRTAADDEDGVVRAKGKGAKQGGGGGGGAASGCSLLVPCCKPGSGGEMILVPVTEASVLADGDALFGLSRSLLLIPEAAREAKDFIEMLDHHKLLR